MFTIRYIDLLRREYLRLHVAMRARAFVARNNRHSWRSFGYLLGMLLVRSHDRSERILWAMKCRAYHGHMHFGSPAPVQSSGLSVCQCPHPFHRCPDRVGGRMSAADLITVKTCISPSHRAQGLEWCGPVPADR